MGQSDRTPPTVLVIFGAGGDLAWRKLVPALYHLFVDKWLPEQFQILGIDRKPLDDRQFRERLRSGAMHFARYAPELPNWGRFEQHARYVAGDITRLPPTRVWPENCRPRTRPGARPPSTFSTWPFRRT